MTPPLEPHWVCDRCGKPYGAQPIACECGGREFVALTLDVGEGARMGVDASQLFRSNLPAPTSFSTKLVDPKPLSAESFKRAIWNYRLDVRRGRFLRPHRFVVSPEMYKLLREDTDE